MPMMLMMMTTTMGPIVCPETSVGAAQYRKGAKTTSEGK